MFHKKKQPTLSYDPAVEKPVIKASICTGEQTAGFLNLETNQYRDDMLIRGAEDLYRFKTKYGIDGEIEKIY
ncbi:MAG: aspartate dehydrogenase [Eubacterium sp.]|nr:aspartate dehydrogenase [Eubacterium sp.]